MNLFPPETLQVAPGATYVPSWLGMDEQLALTALCRRWGRGPNGFRVPTMPDGAPLSIQSVCLGWHWDPYRYSRFTDPAEAVPVKPFPPELAELAQRALLATGQAGLPYAPDACIINWYGPGSRLGLHQDKGEGAAVLARGSPVVSISLGDSAVFRFGNTQTKSKPYQDILLHSGDLFVFGGPARMAFHGVPKTLPGSAPKDLGLKGRVNITIRESGFG